MANLSPWRDPRNAPVDLAFHLFQRDDPRSPSERSSYRLFRSTGTLSLCRRCRTCLGSVNHEHTCPIHSLLRRGLLCLVHCPSPRDWLVPFVSAPASFSGLKQIELYINISSLLFLWGIAGLLTSHLTIKHLSIFQLSLILFVSCHNSVGKCLCPKELYRATEPTWRFVMTIVYEKVSCLFVQNISPATSLTESSSTPYNVPLYIKQHL